MNVVRARVIFMFGVVAILLGTILVRLFSIQVIDGKKYALKSRSQTRQRSILKANRGRILDSRGRVLAKTVRSRLEATSEIAAFEISADSSSSKRQYVERVYPYGELAGAVLGYVGHDGDGNGGAEFSFEQYLRGEDGWAILHRDGRNVRYRKMGLPVKVAVDGADVFLTIDVEVQKIVERVLSQAVENLGAKGGICVVMEPHTGRIVAMANEPGFNPNFPSRYALHDRLNKCLGYNYEPGSTFKVVTAASAMQERVVSESDLLDGGDGTYVVYDQVIRDRRPFGKLTMADALKVSSNVCFAKVAEHLGNNRQYRYAKEFGFGAKSGVGLPGEEKGMVYTVNKWSGRTGPTMAIGQEISVTLLQMVSAFCTVANDGVLVEPAICDRVVSADDKELYIRDIKPVRKVVDAEVARRLRKMLERVVDDGTGTRAALEGIPVAGKTGTSQKYDKETGTYSTSAYWSSFIGMAPSHMPVLVCGVVIDEPSNGEGGGTAAAPVFRNVLSQIVSNPNLTYGEEILLKCRKTPPRREIEIRKPKVPITTAGLRFPFFWRTSQKVESAAKPVVPREEKPSGAMVYVPKVTAQDARDAISMVHESGLVPFVMGFGVVSSQSLNPGALARRAEVCTLYCDIGI